MAAVDSNMVASVIERLRVREKVVAIGRRESRLATLASACEAISSLVVVTRGDASPIGRAIELERQLLAAGVDRRVICVDELRNLGSQAVEGTVTVVTAQCLRRELISTGDTKLIAGDVRSWHCLVLDEDAMVDAAGYDCAMLALLTSQQALLALFSREHTTMAKTTAARFRTDAWIASTDHAIQSRTWALPLGGDALLVVRDSSGRWIEEQWLRVEALSRRSVVKDATEQVRADALRCARELASHGSTTALLCSTREECEMMARQAASQPVRWRPVVGDAEEDARVDAVEALSSAVLPDAPDEAALTAYARRGLAIWHDGMFPSSRLFAEVAVDEGLVGLVLVAGEPPRDFDAVVVATRREPPFAVRVVLVYTGKEKEVRQDENEERLGLWAWLRAAESDADESRAAAIVDRLCCVEHAQAHRIGQNDKEDIRRLETRRCIEQLRRFRREPEHCWPWLQPGRLAKKTDSGKWAVIVRATENDNVQVLIQDKPHWQLEEVAIRSLRLTAFRVFMPSDLTRVDRKDAVAAAAQHAVNEAAKKRKLSVMLDELDIPPPSTDYSRLIVDRLDALKARKVDDQHEMSLEEIESELRILLRRRPPDSNRKRLSRGKRALQRLEIIGKDELKPTERGKAMICLFAAMPNDTRALVLFCAVFDQSVAMDKSLVIDALVAAVAARGSVVAEPSQPVADAARRVYRAMRGASYLAEDDFVASFGDPTLLEATKSWLHPRHVNPGKPLMSVLGSHAAKRRIFEGDFLCALRAVAIVLPHLTCAARHINRLDVAASCDAVLAQLRQSTLPLLSTPNFPKIPLLRHCNIADDRNVAVNTIDARSSTA